MHWDKLKKSQKLFNQKEKISLTRSKNNKRKIKQDHMAQNNLKKLKVALKLVNKIKSLKAVN